MTSKKVKSLSGLDESAVFSWETEGDFPPQATKPNTKQKVKGKIRKEGVEEKF
ncbi:AlpA family phage regulatory protein [Nostoc edaphicum]|uniref:AlpA family phage regulatory protein n=1 Tax=Nostoc edaphicum TaxID=264686 RepID=UPI003B82DF81